MGFRKVFENIFLALLSFGCGGHTNSTVRPPLQVLGAFSEERLLSPFHLPPSPIHLAKSASLYSWAAFAFSPTPLLTRSPPARWWSDRRR